MNKIPAILLYSLTVICFFFSESARGQQYVTTFGIQYKPIIPSAFFRNDGFENEINNINVKLDAKTGSSFGMVIRRGLNKRFSFEGGINLVTRKYNLVATAYDTNLVFEQEFKWMSYEIPLQTLVFIRLGEKLFLNAASGLSLTFFPSDIQGFDRDFYQRTFRYRWVKPALTANLGLEWRTNFSGYFYLGASYLQPFSNMAQTQVRYENHVPKTRVIDSFKGNYLTLDLRYFFHENPNSVTKTKLRRYRKENNKALAK